nr:hybrid signal transduction histidine kinase M [Tanacetum cinerariifolium]
TLSKTLQKCLVVEDPQTAKEASDHIATIFHDNKRTRTIALKAESRSLKLGYLSIDAYFRLNNKYENVVGIIVHREPFSDLKIVRSMLTTEEMGLKSKSQAIHLDSSSSSPMILLAELCNTTRRSNAGHVKSSRPCFNFAKGSCRFGSNCKFVHD